jgi:hypothetical protein
MGNAGAARKRDALESLKLLDAVRSLMLQPQAWAEADDAEDAHTLGAEKVQNCSMRMTVCALPELQPAPSVQANSRSGAYRQRRVLKLALRQIQWTGGAGSNSERRPLKFAGSALKCPTIFKVGY